MEQNWWQNREEWYYKIEVEKEVFTPGRPRPNFAAIRRLLRNINVRDMDCLDIGTMEGATPMLLKRAGAKSVVAYDRFMSGDKLPWLPELFKTYNANIDYIGGMRLEDFPLALEKNRKDPLFDLVVFSGVLYHLINPLGYLALARSFCKVGGLFVFETRVVHLPQEILIFNTKGFHGGGNTYFIVTTAWMDYALRMLGLRPLSAVYTGKIRKKRSFRLAILCRSEAAPCPVDADDAWMRDDIHRRGFASELLIDWERLQKTESAIDVAPFEQPVINLENNQSLFSALENPTDPYVPSEKEAILTLDSTM